MHAQSAFEVVRFEGSEEGRRKKEQEERERDMRGEERKPSCIFRDQ